MTVFEGYCGSNKRKLKKFSGPQGGSPTTNRRVSYEYTINQDDTQNDSVNIENEETSLYEAYQSAEYETYDEMFAELSEHN